MTDRWKNRRWMAWTCLTSAMLYPVLVLYTQSEQLGAIAPHFYLFCGAVVGCYVGFSTVDDKWHKQS